MNYATLKSAIQEDIKSNHNQEITGPILQGRLFDMIGSLGRGYQLIGAAVPASTPGTPDERVAYICSTAGTYTGMGNIVVAPGEVAILGWDSSWSKLASWSAGGLTLAAMWYSLTNTSEDDYAGVQINASHLAGYVTETALNDTLESYVRNDAFDALTDLLAVHDGRITDLESLVASGGFGEGSAPDWFIVETYLDGVVSRQRLKLNPKYVGMYAEGYVSAGGISAGGGGGGGISLDAMWNSLTNSVPDAYANTPINIAHIPNITVSKVSDIESWINGKGYMTNADLSNYLPLTGGTMANTNLVTNMNADLLNSVHLSSTVSDWNTTSETPSIFKVGLNTAPNGPVANWAYGVTLRHSSEQHYYFTDIVTPLFEDALYCRKHQYGYGFGPWRQIAFTTSNITGTAAGWTSSATIWGQTLNAGYTITGALSSVTDIDSLLYFDTTNSRVGIGIGAPADTLDVNGSIHATSLRIGAGSPVLVWDAVNSAWHLNGSLYADGFISAGGFSDTSGGGGIDLGAMWASLTNSVPDEYANTPIALAHIPNITVSKVSNIESWIDGKGYLTASAASGTYQPIISDLSTIRSNASLGASAYSSLSNYLPLSGGTMSNTNLVTNMNADLFDSVHLLTTVSDWNSTSTTPSIFKVGTDITPNGPVANWAYGITLRHSGEANLYFSDIVTPLYSTALYYRRHDTEGFSAWKQIAFTDGNVATATALQTSRSIWGQSFNGTADISGALTGVTNITASGDISCSRITASGVITASSGVMSPSFYDFRNDTGYWIGYAGDGLGSGTGILLYAYTSNPIHFYTNGAERMLITGTGNVGIGNSAPSYRLDVTGGIRVTQQIVSTEPTGTAPLSVVSTTLVSNLNSDYLGGVHLLTEISDWNSTSTSPSIFKVGTNTAPNGPVANFAYGITLRHSGEANYYFADLVTPLSEDALYYRRHYYNAFSSWKQIAFTDGNVATATALQTSRSIWGQSFNGTTDVSGALSGASTGEFSSWVKASYYYVGGYSAYLEYANSAIHANVGFYSNNYISAGGLSTSSDARLKTGVQTIDSERAWKVIMGLRPTEFRWIENGEESAGFIAQEVEPIVPFAVKEIGEVKRLNYDNIFTYGIQAIRDMKFWRESTEQRIKRLEKKINELQTELKRLRA